jgi:hypothetical protein
VVTSRDDIIAFIFQLKKVIKTIQFTDFINTGTTMWSWMKMRRGNCSGRGEYNKIPSGCSKYRLSVG